MAESPRLLDQDATSTLRFAADILDDLESLRKANTNRLSALTRIGPDEDGVTRGLGLDESHPDVALLKALVTAICCGETRRRPRKLADGTSIPCCLEHEATRDLERKMRKHPLGPWMAGQKGIGDKQGARLLAAIGDPYWNTLHNRPRTVSELWAYCGLHTLPAGQSGADTHCRLAGGAKSGSSDPCQPPVDAHEAPAWVAARRRKGQKANWSNAAKMRAWNIAVSCIKATGSPYREVYDHRRHATEGRLHQEPCARCGPAGHPAKEGTPWSKAHQHADALRIVSKEILKDLWMAARDLHQSPS